MEYLETLSPLDSRYRDRVKALLPFFSERSFFRYRALVELRYLIAFLEITRVWKLSTGEKEQLLAIANISGEDFKAIKVIEQRTGHDVKALEYFLKEKIASEPLLPYIHFGLTSEDTNNIACALMLSDALARVLLPALDKLEARLSAMAEQYRAAPILARTHGQPASPTTFGKELRVFQNRLYKKAVKIKNHSLEAKLNGATGNYSALTIAFPDINWTAFSKEFITSFNADRLIPLQANMLTTQIEPHDSLIELFDLLRGINTILLDLCRDMWRYISDGWLIRAALPDEIGSSTMPHKVNPINFENSEGNLGLANALFAHFSRVLPVSRLQRDLSGSTVMRNIGSALGYSLLAYSSITRGLSLVHLDQKACLQALESNPQVITEALQIILKREGVHGAYEQLLRISRGKNISRVQIEDFIRHLDISDEVKQEMLAVTPHAYIGLADKLAGHK